MINLVNQEETQKEKMNPLGIKVNMSIKGSMTQALFYDYCNHVVDSLPLTQGQKKLPVILFLDGHVSRWNLAALHYLVINSVYPFF